MRVLLDGNRQCIIATDDVSCQCAS